VIVIVCGNIRLPRSTLSRLAPALDGSDRGPSVDGRRKPGLPRRRTEVAEQRLVVNPVERRILGGGVHGGTPGGQREQVAGMP